MINKKWLALTLAMVMMFSLIGTVGFAQDEYPAAPAIAAELLREAGVKQLGPFVSAVARETGGRNAEFLGIPKDAPEYRDAVRDFLVREGGVAFNPAYVPGMVLWLDASALSDDDKDDEGNIAIWRDESGRGNDAMGTEGRRPTYKEDAIGGLPAVEFDGSQYLAAADTDSWNLDYITIISVVQFNDLTNHRTIVNRSTAAKWVTYYYWHNNRHFRMLVDPEQDNYYHANELPVKEPLTITGDYDGRSVNLWFNGALQDTHEFNNGGVITKEDGDLYIGSLEGSTRFHKGYIAEILIYNKALNDKERESVEGYLMDKYGL